MGGLIIADIAQAGLFVQSRGGPEEQARLRFLMERESPPHDVVDALFADQLPDGGWAPFWAPGTSSIDATCFRLARAEHLGLEPFEPAVALGVAFLATRQQADGSWEEESALAEAAPPWARPGDWKARLYLTANAGFWLCYFGARSGAGPQKAVAFLESHMEEGGLPSFPQANWLAGALFRLMGREDAARRMSAVLLRHTEAGLPAANLAWMLVSLRLAGVPVHDPVVEAAARALDQQQRTDGGWDGEWGGDSDLHTTLEAMRALRAFGNR